MTSGFVPVATGAPLYRYAVTLEVSGTNIAVPAIACDIHCGIVRDTADMPSATVVIPVGTSMADSSSPDVFAQLAGVSRNTRVRITYTSDAATAILFIGYIGGMSIVRTSASYGVAVTIVHWLSALDGTSAYFSGLTAAYGAAVTREISNKGKTFNKAAYTLTSAISNLSATGPWELYLEAIGIAIEVINNQLPGEGAAGSNAVGMGLLRRIKPKLTLTSAGQALAQHSSGTLKAMLGTLTLSNESRAQTLLSKTLVFCEMVSAMLVPHGDNVYVIPDGIFRSAGAITIPDSEQSTARMNIAKNIPLGGCALIAPGGKAEDGCTMSMPTAPKLAYDSLEDGPVMSITPPAWLAGARLQSMVGIPFKVGGKGWHGAGRHSKKPTTIECKNDDTAALVNLISAAGKEYCKLVYAKTMTKGSGGSVTGPLRFDIAPGTTVIIEGPGGGKLYGLVEGLRIRMDTEAGDMSTSFELSHIRSEAEQGKYDASGPSLYEPLQVTEPYA
jgi:hypothetical protein